MDLLDKFMAYDPKKRWSQPLSWLWASRKRTPLAQSMGILILWWGRWWYTMINHDTPWYTVKFLECSLCSNKQRVGSRFAFFNGLLYKTVQRVLCFALKDSYLPSLVSTVYACCEDCLTGQNPYFSCLTLCEPTSSIAKIIIPKLLDTCFFKHVFSCSQRLL